MGDSSSKDRMLQNIKKLKKEIADLQKKGSKLVESEQLLRTLTEKSFAGLYVVQDGKFKFLNANASRFAGYKPQDLVGKKSDFILHPEDREKVKVEAQAMLRGLSTSPHEFRIITKNGGIRWILETVAPITYEGEGAILGNSMDITDHKLAEKALIESERRLADIIEFLPDATLAIDREGTVIAWNRAIEEMTGIPAKDMTGKGNYEYALPFYGARRPIMVDLILKPDKKMERSYSAILKREKDLLIVETWVPALKGEKAFLWGKAGPLYDSNGRIIGAIQTIRDITDRKLSEEALRESEQRLADIIEFLPDATLAINREGTVIAWNRAIEEMTGIRAHGMMGKGNYEYALPFYGTRRPIMLDLILKPDRKIEQSYSAILKREKDLLIVETWVPSLRGEKAFLWGKASPLYDTRGNIVGAIESIRDITERKHAEEDLKRREKELGLKNVQLEDLNAALRVLLKQRDEDKAELEEKVLVNVKKLVMPNVEKLQAEPIGSKAVSYLGTLESNLKDIVSPFARKLSAKYVDLTNREIQIAALIKEDRTTKDIAEMLNISESAINIHRFNIRRKLGLTKKHNLHAYLTSLA